jgi:hypothetical protein
MTDMLRDGVAWLHDQRKQRMASTVTYQRGNDSVDLKATRGETQIDEASGDAEVHGAMADWLITPGDLDFGSGVVRPKRGDTITDVHNGVTKVYEVMPVLSGEVWRFSDPHGEAIRIHTKRTSES